MKSNKIVLPVVLVAVLLSLGFASCDKCSGCESETKKPKPQKIAVPMEVTEGVKPLDQQLEQMTKGPPVPEDLLHCGNDPARHGAIPHPDRPGEFTCPPDLPRELVCAYYYDLASKDPERVRLQEAVNACRLCATQFKKDETYADDFFNQKLIGFTKGPCP